MQNRNPLASLIALAAAAAMLAPAHAAKPEPAPKPEEPSLPSLDELLGEMFGLPPAPAAKPFDLSALLQEFAPRDTPTPTPITQVCAIPQDIADRAGMNDEGFDPHSLEGRTVALLAAALANLRELRGLKANCNPAGAAKCAVADGQIGAAIAAINLSNPA